MKKAVFRSIMALVLVLGLTLAMALPLKAQVEDVGVEKDTIPGTGHPKDVYLVYQEVEYRLSLINNTQSSGDIDSIRDRFAWSTADMEEAWWHRDDEEWVASNPNLPIVFPAGYEWTQNVTHTIRPEHLIPHSTIDDAKAVINQITYEADVGGERYDDSFPKEVQVIRPSIKLEKSVTPSVAQVGQTVEYIFIITNTGDWPLENITLVDDKLGDLTGELPAGLVLGPGDDHELDPIPYTIQAGDLPLTNEATVTAIAEDFDPGEFGPEASPTAVVENSDTATVRSALLPVGGSGNLVSRLALLVPWIVLAGLLAGAAVFFWSRRAQGRA